MSVLAHFVLWNIGLAPARTFYTSAECACLERHAAGKKRLVEIGCWHGVNTRRLRRVMASDGLLFGVDPYEPGRLGFSAPRIVSRCEVEKEANGTMRWIRMTDLDAARWLTASNEGPLDFVFSDSLNSVEGFRATWEAWSALVAPGARYILANSRPTAAMPIEGAGSVVYTRDVIMGDARFRLVETVDTFTVLEKR
jgi:predicted O-methyltransferase YrrM